MVKRPRGSPRSGAVLLRYRCGGARTGFHAYAHAKSRTLILLLSDSLSAVARQRRAPQQHTGTHVRSRAAESRSVPPRRSARLPRCPPSRPRPHYITLHYITFPRYEYITLSTPALETSSAATHALFSLPVLRAALARSPSDPPPPARPPLTTADDAAHRRTAATRRDSTLHYITVHLQYITVH